MTNVLILLGIVALGVGAGYRQYRRGGRHTGTPTTWGTSDGGGGSGDSGGC